MDGHGIRRDSVSRRRALPHYARRRDGIVQFHPFHDIHAADDAAEGGEVAFRENAVSNGGKVDGEQIEFGWRVLTPDGESWAYVLRGTVDEKAGTMKGSFKVSSRVGGGDGSFSATRRAR